MSITIPGAGVWPSARPVGSPAIVTLGQATQAGDILIASTANGGSDSSTVIGGGASTYTGVWSGDIEGGLIARHYGAQMGASPPTFEGSVFWSRCTGDHNGQTIETAGTNSVLAVVNIYRGCRLVGIPVGAVTSAYMDGTVNELASHTWTQGDALLHLSLTFDDDDATTNVAAASMSAPLTSNSMGNAGGNDTGVSVTNWTALTPASSGLFTWTNGRASTKPCFAFAFLLLSAASLPVGGVRHSSRHPLLRR